MLVASGYWLISYHGQVSSVMLTMAWAMAAMLQDSLTASTEGKGSYQKDASNGQKLAILAVSTQPSQCVMPDHMRLKFQGPAGAQNCS